MSPWAADGFLRLSKRGAVQVAGDKLVIRSLSIFLNVSLMTFHHVCLQHVAICALNQNKTKYKTYTFTVGRRPCNSTQTTSETIKYKHFIKGGN